MGSAGQNGGNGRGEVTAPRAPPGGGWGDELSAARAARAQRRGRRPKWVARAFQGEWPGGAAQDAEPGEAPEARARGWQPLQVHGAGRSWEAKRTALAPSPSDSGSRREPH